MFNRQKGKIVGAFISYNYDVIKCFDESDNEFKLKLFDTWYVC